MHKILKKLNEWICLQFPGRRVYFIYTHNLLGERFSYGLKANTEISYWSLKALKEAFPRLFFLRIQGEKSFRIQSIRPQDIVIGHIGETFLRAAEKTKRMIAFYPWAGHEDRSTNTLFNCISYQTEKQFWDKAASIILLTSEYNVREYCEKPRNFWFEAVQEVRKQKSFRFVHQPIDLSIFQRIKRNYLTSNFLYIGNDAHMKCVSDSKRLVETLGRTLHLYGIGDKRLDHLNCKQVGELPNLADFFIQPGLWEGQCVSILESAARGFIPVVSPETGYPYDHPYLLRYGDDTYNLTTLKKLLNTSPEERKELGDELHKRLLSDPYHNQWSALTHVLVEEIEKLR